ncbi:MAG: type II toxin-antitoxin system VapC family toxin [Burkholderiales bacterium]
MRLLLDTQIYLWFLADSKKLSKAARLVLARADEIYVSAASVWEAAIKIGTGKLSGSVNDLVAGIAESGFKELPVSAAHAAAVANLRDRHRDPFDRLLLAQAITEPLRLVTADDTLASYTDQIISV